MKKKKVIIASSMAAILFGSLFVGGTLALYSQTFTNSGNHLISGSLKAGLYLTSLVKDELKTDGTIQTLTYNDATGLNGLYNAEHFVTGKGYDLGAYTGYIFQVSGICPTMGGEANFAIYNDGDIAFNYTIKLEEVKYYSWSSAESTYVLDDTAAIKTQLTITRSKEGGTVLKNASDTFKVSYAFADNENNNAAMNQKITFDIQVIATQVTKA